MKILFVDDDAALRAAVGENLKAESYIVDLAADGRQGSFFARTNHYDLVILDYSMPEKNGAVVCEEIRAAGLSVPILFLSVFDEVEKKVGVLEKGADDYLEKPFSYAELSARIKAMLRRPRELDQPILSAGPVALDTKRQAATLDGKPLYLTRKEYVLLEYLLKHKNTIMSRTMIMEHVWSADSDPFSNTVEAHIANLRKKIHAGEQRILRTVPGRGYMISDIEG